MSWAVVGSSLYISVSASLSFSIWVCNVSYTFSHPVSICEKEEIELKKRDSPPANLGVFINGEWTHVDEQCHTAVHERVKRGSWQTISFMEGPINTFMNDHSLRGKKSCCWTGKKNPLHQRFCWWSGFIYLLMNNVMLLFMNNAMLLFMNSKK